MGPVEDPDFAKQNDRDSAARPLADIPTKLLKQGLDVSPRQAAAYGTGEDQLKGALVLPLHPSIVLPPSTIGGICLTAFWILITLAITARKERWVTSLCGLTKMMEAGQVYGRVGKCSWPSAGTFPDGVSTRQTSQHLDQANKDAPRSDAVR